MAVRTIRTALLALMVAAAAVSCSVDQADDGPADATPTVDDAQSAARSVDESPAEDEPEVDAEPAAAVLDAALDPRGVITAAVLLHTGGDVDAALADGFFTRAELDAARAGLEDGSLDYLFD